MTASDTTGGGFVREALHNRVQSDLGANGDADAALTREKEPEAARA